MNPNQLMQCGFLGCMATFLTTYNAAIESTCAIVSLLILAIGAIRKFYTKDEDNEDTKQEETKRHEPSNKIYDDTV